METLQPYLVSIWFFILFFILLLYLVLDGFDLGIGVLSLFSEGEVRRGILMESIAGVWHANQTWLVVFGALLFAVFPVVYGVVLSALYVPVTVMLFGLIFRGVAFEFRGEGEKKRVWNAAFGLGSLAAAVAQGYAIGGVLSGLPMSGTRYIGGFWDWLNPFSTLVAVMVVSGYALLGATYLLLKTDGDVRDRAYRSAMGLSLPVLLAAGLLMAKIHSLPFLSYVFYFIALLSFVMLLFGLVKRREKLSFLSTLLFAFFLANGIMTALYPYMVPPHLTAAEAAAAPHRLAFVLIIAGLLLPVMIFYNAYQYRVFRGRVGREDEMYGETPPSPAGGRDR